MNDWPRITRPKPAGFRGQTAPYFERSINSNTRVKGSQFLYFIMQWGGAFAGWRQSDLVRNLGIRVL